MRFLDKNGKEIHEGDFVSYCTQYWDYFSESLEHYFPICKVIYKFSELGLLKRKDNISEETFTPLSFIRDDLEYSAEIIGNFYENPELIKLKYEFGDMAKNPEEDLKYICYLCLKEAPPTGLSWDWICSDCATQEEENK